MKKKQRTANMGLPKVGQNRKFEYSYFYQHLWLIEHLCFYFPHFAKPQTVSSNRMNHSTTIDENYN
ncbi:MAG: hypothetical protein WAS72_07115 [Saprospiraceae bacterium]